MKQHLKNLSPGQIEKIARILGDTEFGLNGGQVGHILKKANINDPAPRATKRTKHQIALASCHHKSKNSTCVYNFIFYSVEPDRYVSNKQEFNKRQEEIKDQLRLLGSVVRIKHRV